MPDHSRHNVTFASNGRRRAHFGVFFLLLAVIVSSLAGCANSQTQSNAAKSGEFASSTRVVLFEPGIGQWTISTFGQTKPGSEFYYNGQFYRVDNSDKAQVVPHVDSGKLFEADRPTDATSRRPRSGDVVQILGKDTRPVSHELYVKIQPGTTIRFQGVAYDISSKGIGHVYSSATSTIEHIEITPSAWQHVMGRHTAGGAQNAGKSVFNAGVDISALIKDAQLITPIPEPNGYVRREFDAGRNIGVDRATNQQTSTYTVITTESGRLVTAFPGLP